MWTTLLVAMDERCATARQNMERLTKTLHLGIRHAGTWEYCGKQIHVSDKAFRVTCPKGLRALEELPIQRGRPPPESPLTPAEVSQYRSIVGSLIYLSTWVRWDLACSTSICARRTLKATAANANTLNKVVALAVNRSDLG